jgi:predicted TIM-barrel fold metal-dependent hydrolase
VGPFTLPYLRPAIYHVSPGMKFFDCNVMIGQTVVPTPNAILDVRALLGEMDRLEIDQVLFFHYAFTMDQKNEMNRLTQAAARQSNRLVPAWVLSTAVTRRGEKLEDQIDRMLDSGIKAGRVFPDEGPSAGPLCLKPYLLENLYARMDQHHIPLLIPDEFLHGQATRSSPNPEAGYDDIEVICQNFPDLPVVVLEPAYNSQQFLLTVAQRHKNFYFSMPIYGLFRELENTAAVIGADRILFGSNMPVYDPSLGIGMILYADMNDRDKQLISGGNLARLLEAVR